MPKVVLLLENFGADKARTVSEIRDVSLIPLNDIVQAVAEGRPVFERELFGRNHEDFAEKFVRLLEYLELHRIQFHAVEVLDNEKFDKAELTKYYQLNSARLQKIIESRLTSMEEQRQQAWLEEGAEEEEFRD